MRNIKFIEFYTENCEKIRIDGEYINYLTCNEITKSLQFTQDIGTKWYKNCKSLIVSLSKCCNEEMNFYGSTYFLFDRLQSPDIVYVSIKYDNGRKETYTVPWKDTKESDECNKWQRSAIDEDGDLLIAFGKKKYISDYLYQDILKNLR